MIYRKCSEEKMPTENTISGKKKWSFKNQGEIQMFPDKQNTKPTLQKKMLSKQKTTQQHESL